MTEHITVKVVRRTSPYNKYIKWFRECYARDGHLISSCGYKTEREAREFKAHVQMPIGDRLVDYYYDEVLV